MPIIGNPITVGGAAKTKDLVLYSYGTMETDASGGLVAGGNGGVAPTRTEDTDNYYMRGVGTSSAGSNGTVVTDNPIDVTGYTKIVAKFSEMSGNATRFFGVTANKAAYPQATFAESLTATSTGVSYELDISALTGRYYIGFGVNASARVTWTTRLVELVLKN